MIITKLQGGLGNQMFQYAASKAIALKHSSTLFLDITSLIKKSENQDTTRHYELMIFNNITDAIVSDTELNSSFVFCDKKKLFSRSKKVLRYSELSHCFDKKISTLKPPLYLNGYFQNEMYFKHIRFEIMEKFSFDIESIDDRNKKLLSLIDNQNSISIHVRRGDYLNKSTFEFHGICDMDYYNRAIQYLNDFIPDPYYFVFSDEPYWTKKHILTNSNKVIYIDCNSGSNSWVDMFLMKNCKHNIISNSTFSWWAAWLNENTQKLVIAPKRWFMNTPTDIIPCNWVKI